MSTHLLKNLNFLGQVSLYTLQYVFWSQVILCLLFDLYSAIPCTREARSNKFLKVLSSIFSGNSDFDLHRLGREPTKKKKKTQIRVSRGGLWKKRNRWSWKTDTKYWLSLSLSFKNGKEIKNRRKSEPLLFRTVPQIKDRAEVSVNYVVTSSHFCTESLGHFPGECK